MGSCCDTNDSNKEEEIQIVDKSNKSKSSPEDKRKVKNSKQNIPKISAVIQTDCSAPPLKIYQQQLLQFNNENSRTDKGSNKNKRNNKISRQTVGVVLNPAGNTNILTTGYENMKYQPIENQNQVQRQQYKKAKPDGYEQQINDGWAIKSEDNNQILSNTPAYTNYTKEPQRIVANNRQIYHKNEVKTPMQLKGIQTHPYPIQKSEITNYSYLPNRNQSDKMKPIRPEQKKHYQRSQQIEAPIYQQSPIYETNKHQQWTSTAPNHLSEIQSIQLTKFKQHPTTTDFHQNRIHPTKIKENKYLQKLSHYKVSGIKAQVERVMKKGIVVGQSGAGKSSLLNYLFGLKLETGMGGCTQKLEKAYTQSKHQIYDTPALPQTSSFNEANTQKYKQFLNYDKIFVLFESSLKNIEKFVKLAAANKKDLVFIRTKCDCFDRSKLKTLDEELEKDQSLLESWGIRNIRLYSATANTKQRNEFDKSALLRQFMIQ